MTDPLSIITATINIAAAVISSSKAINEFVSSIRDAPNEIKLVARDVQALYPVVSWCAFMREKEIRELVSTDESLMETVVNLRKPLGNCEYVLGRILVKLERLPYRRSNGVRVIDVCSLGIKWALFEKGEMRDLKVSLEATKETLHFALTTLST